MADRRIVGLGVVLGTGALTALLNLGARSASAHDDDRARLSFQDPSGQIRTLDVNGPLDLTNPFFQDLGTNGRTCFSCHRPDQGWSITPSAVRQRFEESRGLDPIFRANDGSNCEAADVSTLRKRKDAFSLLLDRGLIRVAIDVPTGAEFIIQNVDDPYQCHAPLTSASMYRRPLPSTNLGFLSAVMWDGRESSPTTSILQDLAKQADDATTGHAQSAAHLSDQEAAAIVAFETGLFTAQARDRDAGSLRADGAGGGPAVLARQPFFTGINDPVGLNPTGAAFDPNAFTIFDAWGSLKGRDATTSSRRAIARGQQIFNTKSIVISGVAGLNNQTFPNGVTVPEPFTGTCTTCHDSPNAGDHSVKAPLNIGLTDPSRRTPDMPLYTLLRRHRRDGDDHGSGPGDGHRQVGGHRQVQGADPSRPRRARALLPQRLRRLVRRGARLLRDPVPHRPDAAGKGGSGGVSEGALRGGAPASAAMQARAPVCRKLEPSVAIRRLLLNWPNNIDLLVRRRPCRSPLSCTTPATPSAVSRVTGGSRPPPSSSSALVSAPTPPSSASSTRRSSARSRFPIRTASSTSIRTAPTPEAWTGTRTRLIWTWRRIRTSSRARPRRSCLMA
jgi:hypothetical protein